MLLQNRIIFQDDAVLTDYSRELSDINAGTLAASIVAAEDALYIGSDMPFNHRYFIMSAFNATAGSVSVEIWNGTTWISAVDVIDQTVSAGKPFAQDGMIMWSTDRSSGWAREGSSENIPELASFKIYDCYWVRLTFSANFTPTISYVGHKFAKDIDLNAYYADLNRDVVREGYFETATANWNAVHVVAAEELIRDLRTQKVIRSVNQVFDPDTFRDAACHKLAEIVYSGMGPSYGERRDFAIRKYKEAMNKLVFGVDQNGDGRISDGERGRSYILRRR